MLTKLEEAEDQLEDMWTKEEVSVSFATNIFKSISSNCFEDLITRAQIVENERK